MPGGEPPVFSSKPMINISTKNEWDEPADVPEEEDAEETGQNGWRASGVPEEVEQAAATPGGVHDWRDEAFHGNSPAKNHPGPEWTPTVEKTAVVEAAETQAVAISTAYVLKSYFPMTKIIMAASPLQMNWREERRLAIDRA